MQDDLTMVQKSRSSPASRRQRDPTFIGRWFWRSGFIVVPRLGEDEPLGAKHLECEQLKRKCDPSLPQLEKKLSFASLVDAGRAVTDLRAAFYNAQPKWSLRDIPARSPQQADEIVVEFLQMARSASAEFCWPVNEPDGEMDWRSHGWKHIDWGDIQGYVSAMEDGWEPPPQIRASMIGGAEAVRDTLCRAAEEEPEAVARVGFFFPRADDLAQVLEDYFEPAERPGPIPKISELGCALFKTIERSPGSSEAVKARQDIRRLISPSTTQGAKLRRGRPPLAIPPDTVRLVYKMCYSLFKQVREVIGFFPACKSSALKSDSLLNRFFPDLRQIHRTHTVSFREYQPSEAAARTVSYLLKMSYSKVKKICFESESSD